MVQFLGLGLIGHEQDQDSVEEELKHEMGEDEVRAAGSIEQSQGRCWVVRYLEGHS